MRLIKKLVIVFLAICVLSTQCITAVPAASKNYMSKLNVRRDLKSNKSVTYKRNYAGIGLVKETLKITDYKIKNSSRKGYKELTFTLKFNYPKSIKPAAVRKNTIAYNKTGKWAGERFYAIVDHDTGKCLEVKNKQNVTVEQVKTWTNGAVNYYFDKDGASYIYVYNTSVKLKITYPQNYKGLCIVAGGSTSLTKTKNDTKFFNGKAVFGKTSYYSKKDKSVAHLMRVTK